MSKRRMVDTSVPEDEVDPGPSRSDRRADRKKFQAELDELTRVLITLRPVTLKSLNLDQETIDEVIRLTEMSKGSALARQRRRVARLLRTYDVDVLSGKLAEVLGEYDGRVQILERWRVRLVEEGDPALHAYLQEHPDADRQRIRHAVKVAAEERAAGTETKRWKELYRLLKSGS